MDKLNNIVLLIQHYLADYILIILLLGGGVIFTIRLGFIQIRGFKAGWKRTFGGLFSKKGTAGKDGMSSFQALATAIAAQVGTGNIAGAATALAIGGPGAIFWMWIAAFLGMATIFGEAIMAQKYKHVGKDGHVTGGPVYYIQAAFKGTFGKILAAVFSFLIIFALGFMGNAVQSNSIASAFHTAFGIPQIVVGIIIAAIALFVFVGGISRIAKVTETIVPIMACFYIIGSLIVIFANFKEIPYAFYSIVVGAFKPSAVSGGAVGATVKLALTKGVARGLFSNEAGMGSTPHAHAVAKVEHPVEQGFVAMIGVFIDTFVILNLTALVIITTQSIPTGLTGTALSQYAFSSVFGKFGNVFIAICMFFFAFSTIIGWYFFGQANVKYLFGKKAVKPYAVLVSLCVLLGSLAQVDLVWNMADCFNSLMVIPNILALFFLSSQMKELHDDYYHNFLKNKKVKNLDVVIATHPDSDHIGSLDYIIDNFDVEKIYMPNQTTDSECYINLIDSCNKKNLKVNYLSKDDSFNLDDSTNIYVLSPSYITDNNNSNSIVLNISYKNNNFLFTGDCEESNEMDMINSYNLEDIDFLKVAHHGSYTASSLTFLEETTPDIAVISCGYKNSYGHPHKSTLDNLESVDAKIFRTDQNGSMQFYSDGEKIYSKVKYKEYK